MRIWKTQIIEDFWYKSKPVLIYFREKLWQVIMEQLAGMKWILAICALILLIIFMKEKMGFVVRIVCRGVLCSALIWAANQALFFFGMTPVLGINPATVLTSAILGFPGVCLLFGIAFL
jgi:inhibitor of the pro-sigma K processing machinery